MSRRNFFTLVFIAIIFCKVTTKSVPSEFDDSWDIIDSRIAPKWHHRSKFGILIHIGVYSSSKIGSESFWYDWKVEKDPTIREFMETKSSGYSYQDLAADFKASFFNAEECAEIVKKAGARYLLVTAKHHDGFALWNSSYSTNWNSVDVGPHLNFLEELKNSTRAKNLKFGIFYSLMEWFHPLYIKDKLEGTQNFVDHKILPELKELVEQCQPDFIWSDGESEMSEDYWKSAEFLLWLFTNSSVKRTVVVNDRWGEETLCQHGTVFTCNGRSKVVRRKFENLIPIDKFTWGHNILTSIDDIMTVEDLIYELISTVAANGNLLLNIGVNEDGIIENIYVERLEKLGMWLMFNGEGIFGTHPFWKQQEEENDKIWYTTKIRGHFEEIFIFVLEYPFDSNEIELDGFVNIVTDDTEIFLLGFMKKIEFSFKAEKLVIKFPEKRIIDQFGLNYAWTFKILNKRKKIRTG